MNRLARFAGFGRRQEDPEETDLIEDDPPPQVDAEAMREAIIVALRAVYDPEIPINIYDLGLIYVIDVAPNGDIDIDMTLTAPACPVAGMMPLMVKDAVAKVEGAGEVKVRLVWDPPWNQDNMSDEARLQLGLM